MRSSCCIPRIFLLPFAILLTGLIPLRAQQLKLEADKDTIGFNETVTVSLSGDIADITAFGELPQSDGFIVTGRTSNYYYNNALQKIHISQTFTLQPLRAGKSTVGPCWVQAGSKRIFSNSVSIYVRTNGSSPSQSGNMFLRCEPSRKKVYRGEQVVLTLRLYRRTNDQIYPSDRPLAKSFDGFLYVPGPYPMDEAYDDTMITVNGITYQGIVMYREFVYPNTTGKLKLPSYSVTCTVNTNPYPTGNPLIDNLNSVPVQVDLVTDPVPIEVLPLPDDGKPDSFKGDVGNYSLSASIDKTEVRATEAVKLSVTVNGEGNIGFVQVDGPKYPDGVSGFAGFATDSTTVTSNGVSGYKTFTWTIIPQKEGDYVIPGMTFSYYDVAKKQYITLHTEDFHLKAGPPPPQNDKTENNLPTTFLSEKSVAVKFGIILLTVFTPLLLLLFFLLWKRRRDRERKAAQLAEEKTKAAEEIPETPSRSSRVKTETDQLFWQAEQFLHAGNSRGAVLKMYEGLLLAASEKCELSREEASVAQLRYRLGVKKTDPQQVDMIIDMINKLAALRYTPAALSPQETYLLLQQARALATGMGF